MGRHDATTLTKARDELMSHIVRCEVLEAKHEHRIEWLDETLDYIAGKYHGLDDLKLAQLELIGRQYLKPVIPHGKQHNAVTRDRKFQEQLEEQEAQAA